MLVFRTKIPIIIHPSFWVLAALIGWLNSTSVVIFCMWVTVVLFSVLVHELGHALMAKMWGMNVKIELGPMGGLTTYRGRMLPRLKEFIVVLMGPLFGLMLYLLAALLLPFVKSPLMFVFLQITAWANLVWSIFNLAPVHPLDGGKLMILGLEGIFGATGTKISYFLSGLFALGFAVFFFTLNSIIAGAIFFMCAFESFRLWQANRFVRAPESESTLQEFQAAQTDWQERQPEKAIKRLEGIVGTEKESDIGHAARETLANYLLATGQAKRAYDLLSEKRKRLSFDGQKLLQLAAYKLGDWHLAYEVGSKLFLETQDMQVAVLNAFSAAHLNDVQAVLNWLATVKKSKQFDMKALLASEDLNPVRNDPHFTAKSL